MKLVLGDWPYEIKVKTSDGAPYEIPTFISGAAKYKVFLRVDVNESLNKMDIKRYVGTTHDPKPDSNNTATVMLSK